MAYQEIKIEYLPTQYAVGYESPKRSDIFNIDSFLPTVHLSPCQRLWAAVINQHIHDLFNKNLNLHRASSQWLFHDTKHFPWVAYMLGQEPKIFRNKIKLYVEDLRLKKNSLAQSTHDTYI